jgi:uncharacterized protein YjbJ (UPF0337 family)
MGVFDWFKRRAENSDAGATDGGAVLVEERPADAGHGHAAEEPAEPAADTASHQEPEGEDMGLLDNLKGKAEELKDKVEEAVGGHKDKVEGAVDKVGDKIDEKTDGKYADKVDSVQDAVKKVVPGDGSPEAPAAPAAPAPPAA